MARGPVEIKYREMRDRIFDYLISAGQPVPAGRILLDVLQIQSSADKAAGKILRGILGNDSRFTSTNGLWSAQRAAGFTLGAEAAFLFMESIRHQRYLRGAVRFPDGGLFTFDTSAADPERCREAVRQALQRLGSGLLIGWEAKDFRLWKSLPGLLGIPGIEEEFLSLRSMARRALGITGAGGPDTLAPALGIRVPGECAPDAMARFMADCFPLLLSLVPAGNCGDLQSLREWISEGRRSVDFGRFDFGPEFLKDLPESAGVYLMRDRAGEVIYVGKSRNLKRRIGSYFTSRSLESPKTARIHDQLHSLEVLPADNEAEALLLEMRLIRRHSPGINLQTQIHTRPRRRKLKNLLLLVGADDGKSALIYLIRDGRFTARRSALLHRPPSAEMRRKIKAVYFSAGKPKRSRNEWEIEIVASWISGNANRLNWIDVDETGSFREVVRRLCDYLNDPGKLTSKVFYR